MANKFKKSLYKSIRTFVIHMEKHQHTKRWKNGLCVACYPENHPLINEYGISFYTCYGNPTGGLNTTMIPTRDRTVSF
jgi:hypothetical protein